MDWPVDPDEFNRGEKVAHEVACGGRAEPSVDERAALDHDVVVRHEIGGPEAAERLGRSLVHGIVATEKGVERRGVDEDRHGGGGRYASSRYAS